MDLAMVARLEGAILTARGQYAEAEREFGRATALLADAPLPFERGRLNLARGTALRRAGARRDAATLLQKARDGFLLLRATPYVDRTERELAACGLRLGARTPMQTATLTPAERHVAQLAAGGSTNREIARELVISVKTVEYHLGKVFAKLGVRSRTELARHPSLLSAGAGDQEMD